MLVANLPYDIATSLVVNLIIGDFGIRRMCFTVQTEVADRFLGHPGTSDYGPVSIMAQTFCDVRRVTRLPPQAFWPSPKVHSSMIRMDARSDESTVIRDRPGFSDFLRTAFRSRRKTLGHIFARLPAGERLLESLADIGLSSRARPEEVAVEAWQTLFVSMRDSTSER